ncbi:polysaccharide deacetylase family protein [Methylobacillus caricis]|uniref:polysaccharide deacetylase family protein n=1 Tax=Methylobacillus caricis TaxID=1971611 RepID=UPI001CFFD1EA|nr:polysaccharide deacetylase family protein [Methylobacillus caricis]MCB5187371.1 polysaccharide deacetylase family protein [Methylobacillus caricis]
MNIFIPQRANYQGIFYEAGLYQGNNVLPSQIAAGLVATGLANEIDNKKEPEVAKYITDPTTGNTVLVGPDGEEISLSEFIVTPASLVLPAAIFSGNDGWGPVSEATLTLEPNMKYNGRDVVRLSAATPVGSPAYPVLRRRIPLKDRGVAKNRIDIPVFFPSGFGSSATLEVFVSSGEPAAVPPTSTPSNRRTYKFEPDQMKFGRWAILSVDLNATADNSPNIGTSWTSSGTGADVAAVAEIDLFFNFPAGGQDGSRYVLFSDITFGAAATPTIMFGFDGGGSDGGHITTVLPLLRKYGFKASFSVNSQQLLSTVNNGAGIAIAQALFNAGHDITNEGVGHKNYSLAENAPLTGQDADTAIERMAAIGVDKHARYIWTAPVNAMSGVGIQQLIDRGFKFIRYGSKRAVVISSVGKEPLIGVAAVKGDQATSAGLIKWLNSAELQQMAVLYLFHSVTTSENPGATEINLTEFENFLIEVANRRNQGRLLQMSMSQYFKQWERIPAATQ